MNKQWKKILILFIVFLVIILLFWLYLNTNKEEKKVNNNDYQNKNRVERGLNKESCLKNSKYIWSEKDNKCYKFIENKVGSDRDKHGCIGSAGYVWSESKSKCIRPWEEKQKKEAERKKKIEADKKKKEETERKKKIEADKKKKEETERKKKIEADKKKKEETERKNKEEIEKIKIIIAEQKKKIEADKKKKEETERKKREEDEKFKIRATIIDNKKTEYKVKPDENSNAKLAIEKADHTLATEDEIIDFSISKIKELEKKDKKIKDEILKGINNLTWKLERNAAYFNVLDSDTNTVVLKSNKDWDKDTKKGEEKDLLIVHENKENKHRVATAADNLLVIHPNAETTKMAKNIISWLTKGQSEQKALNIVTANIYNTYWAKQEDSLINWFNTNYPTKKPTINTKDVCDGPKLLSCIDTKKPDLLILSNENQIDKQKSDILMEAYKKAEKENIPVLILPNDYTFFDILNPIYEKIGIEILGGQWRKDWIDSLDTSKKEDRQEDAVIELLKKMKNKTIGSDIISGCKSNFMGCKDPKYVSDFKYAVDWYRNEIAGLDKNNKHIFKKEGNDLLKAGILLADKYRSGIDYPIFRTENQKWVEALFADLVVYYSRDNNIEQKDLGQYVTDVKNVVKGKNANYKHPAVTTDTKEFSINKSKQWTTTGWYMLPGEKITIKRLDKNTDTKAKLKFYYARSNTNKVFNASKKSEGAYRGPIDITQQRIEIPADSEVVFSSPYGGPLYVYMENSKTKGPISVKLEAKGITYHPSILNPEDPQEYIKFNNLFNNTEIPHVDLKSVSSEEHLRRDRLLFGPTKEYKTIEELIRGVKDDYINAIYTLAGFKLQGLTLKQSLPQDVQNICNALFGTDCFDSSLHTRSNIQHINYDQSAQCGVACSGNPIDLAGPIKPTGWGDGHELGHNLQNSKLNINYVSEADRDKWTEYKNRSREVSNNIFPYYTRWRWLAKNKKIEDRNGINGKKLFYLVVSGLSDIKNKANKKVLFDDSCKVYGDTKGYYNISDVLWKPKGPYDEAFIKLQFYTQMIYFANNEIAHGFKIDNGFDLFTLLYQYQRIFDKYATNQTDWDANKQKLGFDLFDYKNTAVYGKDKTIKTIVGNDFLLVSLSKITEKDWSPYFDMYGVKYSSLALKQAQKNAKTKIIPGFYVVDYTTQGAYTFPPIDLSDPKIIKFIKLETPKDIADAVWPLTGGGKPSECKV